MLLSYPPSRSPCLRKSIAICPTTVDGWMGKIYLDISNCTNRDIRVTTSLLRKGKFRHPRARQMSAAACFGWLFTPEIAYRPEEWLEEIIVCRQYLQSFK